MCSDFGAFYGLSLVFSYSFGFKTWKNVGTDLTRAWVALTVDDVLISVFQYHIILISHFAKLFFCFPRFVRPHSSLSGRRHGTRVVSEWSRFGHPHAFCQF